MRKRLGIFTCLSLALAGIGIVYWSTLSECLSRSPLENYKKDCAEYDSEVNSILATNQQGTKFKKAREHFLGMVAGWEPLDGSVSGKLAADLRPMYEKLPPAENTSGPVSFDDLALFTANLETYVGLDGELDNGSETFPIFAPIGYQTTPRGEKPPTDGGDLSVSFVLSLKRIKRYGKPAATQLALQQIVPARPADLVLERYVGCDKHNRLLSYWSTEWINIFGVTGALSFLAFIIWTATDRLNREKAMIDDAKPVDSLLRGSDRPSQ
jgi:hypothetical protein